MSFQQFQQRCADCKKEWNAAFGIVGTTIIAQAPSECPHCKSTKLDTIAYGWMWDEIQNGTETNAKADTEDTGS